MEAGWRYAPSRWYRRRWRSVLFHDVEGKSNLYRNWLTEASSAGSRWVLLFFVFKKGIRNSEAFLNAAGDLEKKRAYSPSYSWWEWNEKFCWSRKNPQNYKNRIIDFPTEEDLFPFNPLLFNPLSLFLYFKNHISQYNQNWTSSKGLFHNRPF